MKSIKVNDRLHFMGICGTAMGSLAGLMQKKGFNVTGSDQNIYPPMSDVLHELNITVKPGFVKENLEPRPDLVIVGNVIQKKFEEASALLDSDIAYTSLPKAIGDYVIEDRDSIVLCGTHGKTTTTALLSWIAECCDKDPGFLIGGVPLNFDHSFRAPNKNTFIIEGDEYDTAFFDKVPKFIHYKPKYVVLNNIEFDHADIYSDIEDIKKAFLMLMDAMPVDGLLVVNADDPIAMEISKSCPAKVVSFGLEAGDYRVKNRESLFGRNQFGVFKKGVSVADLAIKHFGQHNTMNALACFALSNELGWPRHKVQQALASFKGVKRRQEVIYDEGGITIVEDFAHHPTAVKLTVGCMKEAFPDRRVWAIFEPRSATARSNRFFEEYIEAFEGADKVILPSPYNVKNLPESELFQSEKMVEILNQEKGEQKAHYCVDVDGILSLLDKEAVEGDVLLLMSNGAFEGIYDKVKKLF